jgi:multidrug efflux pump subunit AcrB
MTMLGEQPFANGSMSLDASEEAAASHLAEIQVALAPKRAGDRTLPEIVRRWRELVGDVPGAVEVDYRYALSDVGAPIEVELSGHDLDRLRLAAGAVRSLLAGYPGVFDVSDSFRGGKQELEYQILPAAESLGLSLSDLARQLRQGFHGAEAQTIQRGRDEVKVMVRYPKAERRSLDDVQRVRIRGPDGSEVPFSSVAQVSLGIGYAAIRHVDRRRVVSVTADVDTAVTTPNEVVASLRRGALAKALDAYPGVHATFEGEQAEQRDFLRVQLIGMAASLAVGRRPPSERVGRRGRRSGERSSEDAGPSPARSRPRGRQWWTARLWRRPRRESRTSVRRPRRGHRRSR